MSNVTRSAACSSVRPEMSSTILVSFGSALAGGGGGVDDDASAAAVASQRDEPAEDLRRTRKGRAQSRWVSPCTVCHVPAGGANAGRCAQSNGTPAL